MTYATLLIHMQPGRSNDALLKVAGVFVERFGAHVIGVAACQPMMVVSGDGYVSGDVFDSDQQQITGDLERAEQEFRGALRGVDARLEWRSSITIASVTDYLAVEARCADLVMTGAAPTDTLNLSHVANPGELAMQAGRPVLIVPSEPKPLSFGHAFICWTDTRESRRATFDALPLLKLFPRVTVLEIADADDVDATHVRVKDVIAWLGRHGVVAEGRVEASTGSSIGQLARLIDGARPDLVVAGAYGHSRLREWVAGGVTRSLLLDSKRCVLTSH